jgi:hypothetical protein
LIGRGASIDGAVDGAAAGGHQACADAFRRRESELIKRRRDIASMMSKDKLSFPAALKATDPDSKIACGIILYLAMRPNSKTLPLATYLIPDVWGIVLDYVTPTKLSTEDKKQLGNNWGNTLFTMDRCLLSQDLVAYANSQNPAHKARATSMALAVAKTTNEGGLEQLLSEQRLIIDEKNPRFPLSLFKIASRHLHSMSNNPTIDGFQAIIKEHYKLQSVSGKVASIKPCDSPSAHCSGACQDSTPKSAP